MGDIDTDRAPFVQPVRLFSDELSYPFDFERKHGSLRTAGRARPQLITLLRRLAVPDPERALAADKGIERQLVLYGTEVLLNIDYYYARSHREERKQWIMNAGIYGLALAFVGFGVYVFLDDQEAAMASSTQIAAVVGAVLAGVKFLTESQDFQKTRSSFWQAAAELKMRLYGFLGEWVGRAWDEKAGSFTPEFVIALQGEIKASRDLQLEERRRFYDLMATPTRLLGATQALSGDATAAVNAFVQAGQMREQQRRQHDLEQIGLERDRLYTTYPDDATRPPAVTARLAELDTTWRLLSQGSTMNAALTAAIVTTPVTTPPASGVTGATGATTTTATGGATGVPFDGRRSP